MVGLLVALLVAALAYWLLVLLTGSTIVGIVAAVLILLAGVPTGGFGMGGRFGGGRFGGGRFRGGRYGTRA